MADPVLAGYPTAPEEAVLDALRSVLRDDPVIVGLAPPLTLWLGDGDPEQEAQPAEGELPAVKLWAAGQPAGTYTENAYRSRLRVHFDCYAPGVHQNDLARVIHVVRQAIWTNEDPARGAVIKQRYARTGWVFLAPQSAGEFRAELPRGRWAKFGRLAMDATLILGTI